MAASDWRTKGKVDAGDLGTMSVREFAQRIARLKRSGGDGPSLAKDFMEKYGADIPDDQLKAVGLKAPGGDKSIFGRLKGVGGSVLSAGLDLISRPGQAALEGIQAVRGTLGLGVEGEENSYGDVFKALGGSQTHHLNLREAAGRDPNAGGLLAGFFDTVGTIATDPLTYLSAGTSAAAETGLRIAGKEVGEQIAARGVRSLGTEGVTALKTGIMASEEAGRAGKTVRQALFHPGMSAQEAFTARTMSALEKGGQGGIKFVGKTIPGFSAPRLSQYRKLLQISDEGAQGIRAVGHLPAKVIGKALTPVSKILEPVKEAVIPRYLLAKAKGAEGAQRFADAVTRRNAGWAKAVDDAGLRLHAAAADAGLDEAARIAIIDSMEKGTVAETAAALRTEGREKVAGLLEEMDKVRHEADVAMHSSGVAKSLEEAKAYREASKGRAIKSMEDKIMKKYNIPREEARARALRTEAGRRADVEATYRSDLIDATEGAGRKLTSAESEQIGRATARTDLAQSDVTRLDNAIAKAEAGADEARTKAFDKALTGERPGFGAKAPSVPAARQTRAEAQSAAEKAVAELKAHQEKLLAKQTAGKNLTKSDMRRLGTLEGRVQVTTRAATKAEAIAKKSEGILNRAVERAAKKAEAAGVKDATALARKAEAAKARVEKLLEHQRNVRAEIEERAALGAKEPTMAQSQRLGAVAERTRAAESAAKEAEGKLLRSREQVRKALSAVPKIADKAADKAMVKYIKKNFVLMNSDKHVLHSLTEDGKKLLQKAGFLFEAPTRGKFGTLTGAFRKGGSIETRTLEGTARELNDQYAELLGKPGFKMFEENPISLTLKNTADAYRAVSEVRFLEDVAKIGNDIEGKPWVLFGKESEEQAKKLGYKKITSKYLDGVWIDPALEHEIMQTHSILYDDKALSKWSNMIDKWGSLWAGYATTPILFGTGFFARNAMGNMFNNLLAGVTNPALYIRAAKAQRAYKSAVEETGRKIGPEFEAALVKRIGERDTRMMMDAIDEGVHETGYFGPHELGAKPPQAISFTEKDAAYKRALARLHPLDKDNIFLEHGKKFNRMLENNARLAHFFGKVEETGSKTLAARSVKKYLFDYSDLTAFEREHIRKFVRFYTYMRKNTPLQFSEIIHHPGKFAGMEHIREGVLDQFSDGNKRGPFPGYTVDAGDIPLGKFMIGLDTPLSAATQAVQPAVSLLANLPGAKGILTKVGLKNVAPEGGFGDVARQLINVPQGGPIELIKGIAEEAQGKSFFTGAPLKKGGKATAIHLAEAILPVVNKAEKTIKVVGDLDGKDQARIRLLNTLLGVHVLPLDEKTAGGEFAARNAAVQSAIDRLTDEGVKVPTLTELRDAGLVPKAPKTKTKKKKARTASQRRREALLSLEEKGADLSKTG